MRGVSQESPSFSKCNSVNYGFDSLSVEISNKEELNKHITDEQIYHHYLDDFVVDEYMISPRGEDTPSFKVDWYDNRLCWRDFGNDLRPADAVNLVQYLEELQGRSITYHDAMMKIKQEVDGDIPYTIDVNKLVKEKPDLRLKYRGKFKRHEANYWIAEKLDISTLRRFGVFPAEIWYNDRVWHHSVPDDPLFVYLWDAAIGFWKGYRPQTSSHSRFIESECVGRVQGFGHMLPSETCIITKSYKDVMSYHELGYTAVAPQSESVFMSLEQVQHLKEIHDNLFINYDPDKIGIKNATKYSEMHNIPCFHFGNEDVKDVTEFRKSKNDDHVKSRLRLLMK